MQNNIILSSRPLDIVEQIFYSINTGDLEAYIMSRYISDPPITSDFDSTYPGDDSLFEQSSILNNTLQGYLASEDLEDRTKYDNINNNLASLLILINDMWTYAPDSNVIPSIILLLNLIYTNTF